MRKTCIASLLLSLSLLLFYSCRPIAEERSNYSSITKGAAMGVKDVLLGLWSTPCETLSSGNSRRYDLEFYQGRLFAKHFKFKDKNCDEKLQAENLTFLYDLETPESVEITWQKGSLTLYTGDQVNALNEEEYLGSSSWALGKQDATEALKEEDELLTTWLGGKSCSFETRKNDEGEEILNICVLSSIIDSSQIFIKEPDYCCQGINSSEKAFLSPYPCDELRADCRGTSPDTCSPTNYCKWDGTTCAFDTTKTVAKEVDTCPKR